ncbi:RNA-binding protein 4.1 [Austrofundulus limnaeus]|uniref:RNA-binding protein 4.1-like n=1 Tax=Austrofundulus limnaeus TaxID=52670 RepID=A0A2I4CAL1_AUSLI|nr:PREDICTED: RNA-binding protein 4.1-like [Austrofundulus limnaeus]XP_013877031.1 PREDICTED: RNA-binding protein 4.1-like [Austrofundulus limnaeus]
MVKLFIGNLTTSTTVEELRELFEKYGTVTECDIVKNFGFVHLSSMSEAKEAIKNLHQMELHGSNMNVLLSKEKPKAYTKLHITNLSEDVSAEQLRAQFEEFGTVLECAIVKNYAFVHMERMEDAKEAISKLDNRAFKGKLMKVQLSTSRLRTAPGMGDHKGCFVCGKHGHWSKNCPVDRDGDGARSGSSRIPPRGMPPPQAADYMSNPEYSWPSYSGRPPLPPPPRPPPLPPPPPIHRFGGYGSDLRYRYPSRALGVYTDRSLYDRDRLYSSVDYYEKYRAMPYASTYLEARRMSHIPPPPPLPPPPPAASLSKLSSSAAPYERQRLSPPSAAAVYYTQEYSAIEQAPASSATYSYERTRLSPEAGSRSAYPVLRPKNPYAAQRYAPY